MKYQAKPVIVDAHEIVSVSEQKNNGEIDVATRDGVNRVATPEMCARYRPKEGDYWVVQEDGYEYLNPKDVFERKYQMMPDEFHNPTTLKIV